MHSSRPDAWGSLGAALMLSMVSLSLYVRQKEYARARPLIAELEARPVQRNAHDIAMRTWKCAIATALLWLQRACSDRIPAMGFLRVAQSGRRVDLVRNDRRFGQILECVENEVL